MSDRIVMRVGESLVAGGPPGTAAEPEVAIGEMDGAMGSAFANLLEGVDMEIVAMDDEMLTDGHIAVRKANPFLARRSDRHAGGNEGTFPCEYGGNQIVPAVGDPYP